LLYCIPIILLSLFSGMPLFSLIVMSIIMLCVTFVYFGLLTKFNGGVEYYVITLLGGVLLVLFL
jgi:hypothetical protein